jgi:hypothetical protein
MENMKRQVLHVTAFPEGWRVLNEQGDRASELFLDREEAVARACQLVECFGEGKVVVHSRLSAPYVVRYGRHSAA